MFVEPVFGKKFFGREEVLATLHKRVTALKGGYRQNLALAGPMLAGKSSILRHFLKNVDDTDVIPLYIEMTGEDFGIFCSQFMSSLLYHYMTAEGMKPSGDLRELKRDCRPVIPETVRCMDKVGKALKGRKKEMAYETLLGLTSVFKTETGKSCIVILDEFQNISDFHLRNPFQTFGKFIMVQKNTMYIVSSSQKTLLKEILSKKLSLLFGNFEVIDVEGFDDQIARSFVSERIDDADANRKIADYIIRVSQGSPFYLEVLSGRFAEIYGGQGPGRSAKECLLESFAGVLYESEGILNQYFMNNVNFFLEKKSRKKFLPVLISLSRGNSTLKAIQEDMGRTDKGLSNKLLKLQEMDLVSKSGVFYKISDKLFEYWLKHVYCLKSQSLIDDMDIKYLEFKRRVSEDFMECCLFSSTNVINRIADLLSSFNNEKIQIRMNDRKLPRFDSVRSRRISENVHEIICSVRNKSWICHVKQGDIADEHDICALREASAGNEGNKVMRRLFIPLKGVEQNAFLLAKDRNIWIWDIRQLNKVFRIYGKVELVL